MSYTGQVIPIPLGQGGLHTDDSPSAIPPTELILANNVAFYNNVVEKFPGSIKLNATAATSGVYGLFDFWYNTTLSNRRLILLAGNGKIYAMTNAGVLSEIAASGGAPATVAVTNQIYFMTAGAESAAANKKLFMMTGANPVQVISGSGAVRTDIAGPPTDWSSANQPSFGIIFNNRVFAGGNANNPHAIYISSASDHEDFKFVGESMAGAYDGTSVQFPVYPGEGEKLIGALIYKGRLFVFKYPFGAYYLEQPDQADYATWYFVKTENSFGFASNHSVCPVLNDVLIKNASGSITSILATRDFGDIQAGDVLTILRIEQYVRDNTTPSATPTSHSVYYPDRKLAMFTYQSPQGTTHDRILCFRVDVVGKPKACFLTFAQPNCLALRKDTTLIERPVWGDLSGNIYQMDGANADVNGTGYTGEFQTPHMDFGFADPKLAGKNKSFDFLELRFVPEGTWDIFADIYIDGNFTETLTFSMIGFPLLADVVPATSDFILASSSSDPTGSFLSDGNSLQTLRKRLHGTGRTISARFYNGIAGQTFKIATMIFSFRESGEQQTK